MSPDPRQFDPLLPPQPARRSIRSRLLALIVRTPSTGYAALFVGVLTIVFAVMMLWARSEPMLAVGRIVDQPRTARVTFEIYDKELTEKDRQAAVHRAPRVYKAETTLLDELRVSLENLPRAVAAAGSLDKLSDEWRVPFALTPSAFSAVAAMAEGGEPKPQWRDLVARLDEGLRTHPILSPEAFVAESGTPSDEVEVHFAKDGTKSRTIHKMDVISTANTRFAALMRTLAFDAGFEGPLLDVAVARLTSSLRPTAIFSPDLTAARRTLIENNVPKHFTQYKEGDVLVRGGQVLTSDQLNIIRTEAEQFRHGSDVGQPLLADGSVVAIAFLAALGVAAFAAAYAPRAAAKPSQLGAICALLAGGMVLSCWLGATEPKIVVAAATTPAIFVAAVLAVAFDRRTALALGSLLALVACQALQQPIAVYALTLLGVGVITWQLRDVRQRQSMVRAGVVTCLCVFIAAIILLVVQRPIVPGVFREILADALSVAVGALLVGFIILGIVPLVEKLFGMTTGMTLVELRDPQRPLLRELQRRAPGTYNHSLNVASLAEAAAVAIGADGLLAYVGALYHDVGKMNKPEYFVENQAGGPNKHEKLPPAMSLLVIVAHVKDGVELAVQFKLPRILHHFIEAHHGTTLVEYFYHRARRQAEQAGPAGATQPHELEYRYPGPKPRTKEAAILMICDASESASRTLPDPTPARIDALVRAIAHKRLMDGQFDQCDLTLRELNTIIDAVTRTLSSIHHARVAYPEAPRPAPKPLAQAATETKAPVIEVRA